MTDLIKHVSGPRMTDEEQAEVEALTLTVLALAGGCIGAGLNPGVAASALIAVAVRIASGFRGDAQIAGMLRQYAADVEANAIGDVVGHA
jgi:hypothetical protein